MGGATAGAELVVLPFYAFSKLTALTAVGLAVPTYTFFALNPSYLYEPIALVQAFLIMVLAVAILAWPLLGIRRLLAGEKERMLTRPLCVLKLQLSSCTSEWIAESWKE